MPSSRHAAPEAQYATGLTRQNIRAALIAAGKDPDQLDPSDLVMMEDFHSLGRLATAGLVKLAEVTPEDRVLDAGTGIGGTARMLAEEIGCQVTAVDLTEEYCATASWLNEATGLDDRITVLRSDVTRLPFDDGSFDVLISQHVQMNVADKPQMYAEAHRVLAPGGRLALWDITAGPEQPIVFPVPWADTPELSHLVTPEELRGLAEAAGFEVTVWNDLTDAATRGMQAILGSEPNPLGIQVFVPDILTKAGNIAVNFEQNRARVIQAVLTSRGETSG
jgi:ubiquinone/menaquinone biosynthesis C-methylase UbiE